MRACAYAKLSWSLWLTAPAKYDEWDAFMSGGRTCQPYGLALAKAKELASVGSFGEANDGEIVARVASGVEVYRQSAVETIPALLLPGGMLRGHVASADELFTIMTKILDGKSGATARPRQDNLKEIEAN